MRRLREGGAKAEQNNYCTVHRISDRPAANRPRASSGR
jgi:hypothetical protein